MRYIFVFSIGLLAVTCGYAQLASADPVPVTQVNNDLWDVSNGTIVTATSGMATDPTNIFGNHFGVSNPPDSYFQDGHPAGFTNYVEFKTTAPVTIRSLNVWGGDDRVIGAFGQRAFNEFRLYGWNGSAYVLLIDNPITVPYTQQSPFGGDAPLNVHQDILGGFTSDKWCAEFVEVPAIGGVNYGPRVLEMDGFGTFLDGSIPEPGSLATIAVGLSFFSRRPRR